MLHAKKEVVVHRLPFFFAPVIGAGIFCADIIYTEVIRCSKGLSFLVCFVRIVTPAEHVHQFQRVVFSSTFRTYAIPDMNDLGSKGLSFSVRFVPINNQTGIKYICNPSRVSDCAYLFLRTINGAALSLVLLIRRKNHGRTQKYQLICR